MALRSEILGSSCCKASGSLVTGDTPCRRIHSSIAERSYDHPSAATTGSCIRVWLIGHWNTSISAHAAKTSSVSERSGEDTWYTVGELLKYRVTSVWNGGIAAVCWALV